MWIKDVNNGDLIEDGAKCMSVNNIICEDYISESQCGTLNDGIRGCIWDVDICRNIACSDIKNNDNGICDGDSDQNLLSHDCVWSGIVCVDQSSVVCSNLSPEKCGIEDVGNLKVTDCGILDEICYPTCSSYKVSSVCSKAESVENSGDTVDGGCLWIETRDGDGQSENGAYCKSLSKIFCGDFRNDTQCIQDNCRWNNVFDGKGKCVDDITDNIKCSLLSSSECYDNNDFCELNFGECGDIGFDVRDCSLILEYEECIDRKLENGNICYWNGRHAEKGCHTVSTSNCAFASNKYECESIDPINGIFCIYDEYKDPPCHIGPTTCSELTTSNCSSTKLDFCHVEDRKCVLSSCSSPSLNSNPLWCDLQETCNFLEDVYCLPNHYCSDHVNEQGCFLDSLNYNYHSEDYPCFFIQEKNLDTLNSDVDGRCMSLSNLNGCNNILNSDQCNVEYLKAHNSKLICHWNEIQKRCRYGESDNDDILEFCEEYDNFMYCSYSDEGSCYWIYNGEPIYDSVYGTCKLSTSIHECRDFLNKNQCSSNSFQFSKDCVWNDELSLCLNKSVVIMDCEELSDRNCYGNFDMCVYFIDSCINVKNLPLMYCPILSKNQCAMTDMCSWSFSRSDGKGECFENDFSCKSVADQNQCIHEYGYYCYWVDLSKNPFHKKSLNSFSLKSDEDEAFCLSLNGSDSGSNCELMNQYLCVDNSNKCDWSGSYGSCYYIPQKSDDNNDDNGGGNKKTYTLLFSISIPLFIVYVIVMTILLILVIRKYRGNSSDTQNRNNGNNNNNDNLNSESVGLWM
jgi:hypothetical protein